MRPRWTAAILCAVAMLLAACTGGPGGARPLLSLNGATAQEDLWLPLERGKAYFAAGQYGLALDAFKDALMDEPTSVRALNAIAATFDQLGRFDLADRYYEQALKLEPQSAETLNNIGYSHWLRGSPLEARKYLSLAKEIDAADPVIQANLQLTRARDQDTATASRADPAKVPLRHVVEQQPVADAGSQEWSVHVRRIARGVMSLVTRPPFERSYTEPRTYARAESPPMQVAAAPAPAPNPAQTNNGDDTRSSMLVPVAFRAPALKPAIEASTIEVSNGTGRSRMASRMHDYLGSRGMAVKRLTNDDSFSNAVSRITYRPDAKAAAAALAALLPIRVELVPREGQSADVRLLLGADLLGFDADLIRQQTVQNNA